MLKEPIYFPTLRLPTLPSPSSSSPSPPSPPSVLPAPPPPPPRPGPAAQAGQGGPGRRRLAARLRPARGAAGTEAAVVVVPAGVEDRERDRGLRGRRQRDQDAGGARHWRAR